MRELVDVFMMGILGVAAFTDVKKKEISIRILMIITIVSILSAILFEKNVWSVLSGAGIGLCFFFVSKWTQEQIGYGDSWLILALGIYVGGKLLIEILFTASFGAGLFSLCFCVVHKWNRRYAIPFIPFLTAAFIGVVLL